ncbi:hypothetical protein [Candidatus Entotheonella palauensis]|uniref:hypothetical protein n=1 Tax=Candidatus Entotheonella palauensis TaxID=93172 RepID=UPI000B7FCBD6|nr:hypothetical protein [Candidatus Entotheonella palauensis]
MAQSSIAPDARQPLKRHGWAVAAMIACLAISLVSAAKALIPSWSGKALLIGIVIAAIEAMYSFHVLHLPRSRGISIVRYRLAEACLLAIVLRLVTLAIQAWERSWNEMVTDVMTMLWQPGAFFSGEYIVVLLAAWVAWMTMSRTLADMEALYDPYLSFDEQHAPREKLMSRFYWGGGLLVLFIGVTYVVAAPRLADGSDGPQTAEYHLNALIYFLLGTWMLSQIRLTSLMTGWRLQNMTVANGMDQAWRRYGLTFLVLIVLIVAILPTHYSMGLFDTALLGLQTLADLARRLMELLILAVTLPLSWLLSLFGHGEGGALQLPLIPDAPTAAPEPRGRAPFPWQVIRAIAFWLTFLAVTIYLIRSYLEDHPELIEALKRFTLARRLVEILAALLAMLAAWIQKGRQWRPRFVGQPSAEAETSRVASKKRWGWDGWMADAV